jgi:ABC-2 type transport system permease protein
MLKRLRPLIIKEFRQIRRDKRSLGVLLALPAFLVLLIGYAVNFDVKHIPTAIFDQDKTQASRDFLRSFSHSEYFDLKYNVRSYDEVDELFSKAEVLIAIVIPSDFARRIYSGQDASVQVLIDGSNANSATTAIGYVSGIVQSFSSKMTMQTLSRVGRTISLPIDVRPKVWYNPELLTSKFLIPGLFGFILMLTAVVATSLSIVREKERGTMEQMMISSLRTGEIILGKVFPYLVLALASSAFILFVGFLLFDMSVRGSFFWLYVGIVIFLLGALGQGLLVSSIAETTQVAFMLSVFSSFLPTFLLSGFVFPIKSMPMVLQIISNIAPAKFFLVIVRDVMLKGAGPSAFWDQLMYLAIFAVLTLTISSLRLMKKPT